jgi:hypothetical protein
MPFCCYTEDKDKVVSKDEAVNVAQKMRAGIISDNPIHHEPENYGAKNLGTFTALFNVRDKNSIIIFI